MLVFAVYWMMPWQKARVYLLLAASLYFYAKWNHWLAAIIAVSTTLDGFVARAIDGTLDTRRGLAGIIHGLLIEEAACRQVTRSVSFEVMHFWCDSMKRLGIRWNNWPGPDV